MDSSSYVVTLRDRTTETVDGADAYAHERLMTTFYRTGNARGAVDCWSAALASFRTDEILMIRRVEAEEGVESGFHGLQVVPVQHECNNSPEDVVDRRPRAVV